jgi:3-methyladenine DNA glycosylase/8-oxoguanine DNA glycosylase
MTFAVTPPSGFSFWRTVYSHGWCSLPPFLVRKEEGRLSLVVSLRSGTPVVADIAEQGKGLVCTLPGRVSPAGRADIEKSIRSTLRLDEDLSEFYAEARKVPRFRWIARTGAGRMLRSPSVFEDAVKMICTTNCSWALTEVMVMNLCRKLGSEVAEGRWSFPSPGAIAETSDAFLRKEIRAGYRSPYLLELSRRTAGGELDLESWRSSRLPTEELFNEVRSVKGIGPYAAGNILKLLGRYDYLGIDSWCRGKFSELYKKGRRVSDKTIEKYYKPFGSWRGLFFWMDVTKEWYDHKFPF